MNPRGRDATRIGRIDVHSHLLPGVDDGCETPADSIACARALVAAGYTHSFCTPHIWPNVPHNNVANIPNYVARLQEQFDEANVPLKLFSGGELNLRPGFTNTSAAEIVSYGMARKHVLIDFWSDRLPENFEPSMRWLQSLGMTVVLAHPERIRAIQDRPEVLDLLADMGLLLQGNLQCLGDPPASLTRRLAEQFLLDGRYFMLGSDTHGPDTVPIRLKGLARASEMIGEEAVMRLTRDNPLQLVPDGIEL